MWKREKKGILSLRWLRYDASALIISCIIEGAKYGKEHAQHAFLNAVLLLRDPSSGKRENC